MTQALERLYTARRDLQLAKFCCEHVLRNDWDAETVNFTGPVEDFYHLQAYMTAMVVAYGRPFTDSGSKHRLPREFTPRASKRWRNLHGRVLDARHKAYAHSDPGLNEVALTTSPINVTYTQVLLLFTREDLEELCQMIDDVRERLKAEIARYVSEAPPAPTPPPLASGSQPA
ncbi:hypothetical protein [Chelatococcus asaccharovorans]|uniref:HEPN AbiU2-like domain-containing protein n=1 Tax=Chelatococcus asaccharovorans TaxID=28210 RepID=A0A2V3UB39_9HYPH|nr:hypothetical protein [Chelatococcus asaccharovorans]MBS7703305.1 hypothetical protein [Chelatococcus asaccharovorans]PXW61639.1 hypothetical protein C7450_103156 [Chelatococcus asaccharovorans]